MSVYKKSHIPMFTQIVSTAFHVAWCDLLIVRWALGIRGASLAICITYTTNFIALLFYTAVIDREERVIWSIDKKAFHDWTGYLRLGIPGALVIMLDMWCYEIISLMAGYLVIEATAAQIIVSNIEVIFNQIPMGISIAASTLVGGAIGENNIRKAKSLSKMACFFSFGLTVSL